MVEISENWFCTPYVSKDVFKKIKTVTKYSVSMPRAVYNWLIKVLKLQRRSCRSINQTVNDGVAHSNIYTLDLAA